MDLYVDWEEAFRSPICGPDRWVHGCDAYFMEPFTVCLAYKEEGADAAIRYLLKKSVRRNCSQPHIYADLSIIFSTSGIETLL